MGTPFVRDSRARHLPRLSTGTAPDRHRYRERVSIHLVGGGRNESQWPALYAPFVGEATDRASARGAAVPTIGLVVVPDAEDDPGGAATVDRFTAVLLAQGRADVRPLVVADGEQLDPSGLHELDGVFVAGGRTPAYALALQPVAAELLALVHAGTPYLGFSAGAAVAARRALVGGFLQDGVVVCAEDNAEGLDELTVVDGLGLVDVSVDVHAAQWGNVTRLLAAVRVGAVDRGVAIDEDTLLLIQGQDGPRRTGTGRLWWVSRQDSDVVVRLEGGGL
jgi:cyanophycinase